ncbi:MAG: diguanylate cyclase [Nitrospirae bacterium]|nr:diguanylate cyclase [Nitrospirota bacterium]
MFRFTLLRGILIVSVLAVIILPVYIFFFMNPAVTNLLIENAENEAVRVARHSAATLLRAEAEGLKKEAIPADFQSDIKTLQQDFDLVKVKVFSPVGEIIYSTDPREIGHVNKERYFHGIVAKGNNYTKVVKKQTQTLEGLKLSADVVETYVPIMSGSKFIGAFEIYFDITERKKKIDDLISHSHNIIFIIAAGLLAAVVISSLKAGKTVAERDRAKEQLIKQSAELKETNDELLAFYEVSSAISCTINMDELLSIILNTVTGLGVLNVERKGGIFIIEGDRMKLVSHLGHSKAFLELHKDMKIGDCLCGIVAETGEVLISEDSAKDIRHTIVYPDAVPHGHIIVPLKAINKVAGVLYLYLAPDFKIDERKVKMLVSLGNQIGMVIDNARLYEETKSLSLQDPLTGLANRRLMDIMTGRSFARAKKYGSRLSVIMIDIDHFKKYNDTYGYSAGDKLLADIAGIISGESSEADFVIRYGGEEFLILFSEAEAAKAYEAAERIRKGVEAKTGVTVSLGVASYNKEMQTKEDLINRADTALYLAKQNGRNRVEMM